MKTSPSLNAFRLLDHGWEGEFTQAANLGATKVSIISPFIQKNAALRLMKGKPEARVLTRFDLNLFYEGVNDLQALRELLDRGAEIRGIQNLHAKAFIFGTQRAIVGSANLTDAAMRRNHELGFVADDSALIGECQTYFENLWTRAGASLTASRIKRWETEIAAVRKAGGKLKHRAGFRDEGVNLHFPADPGVISTGASLATPAFVKFQGKSNHRVPLDYPVRDEVEASETHWGCAYPRNRRPRQVGEGDIMFLGRLVMGDADDTRIYGRALARSYVVGRDDATPKDIVRREWRKTWPHYIRLREPEFLAGTLANGVSLNELIRELGSDSFGPTAENKARGAGNTDPRRSLVRKPAMRLTSRAAGWLNARFNAALATHGRLPAADLQGLYWSAVAT